MVYLQRRILWFRGVLLLYWERLQARTYSLPSFIVKAMMNYFERGSQQAATLAYYVIFSVFPLVLLLAVAIGAVVGPAVAQEQIARGLAFFLPENTVDVIQETVGLAIEQSTQFGLVALVGLLWSATSLFSNITHSLDVIFSVPTMRSMWRIRVLALFMGLALVVLVLSSFLTSGVLRLLLAFSLELNIWLTAGVFFLPLGLNLVIFALLFRYVPARFVYWDAVLPSAVFGALGWELAKYAFQWYLNNLATFSVIYGGIATGIVLLFWAYLIASIFLFSAELCARLNEWMIQKETLRHQETQRRTIHIIVPPTH